MKKVCILKGSPRPNGNTNALLSVVKSVLEEQGCQCREFDLYGMKLEGCRACRACQKDWTAFGCPIEDEMGVIADGLLDCDLIILATPIYSWYCTAPMKTVLDRMAYGMNKYYTGEKGPSLWAGRELAIITTCGYSVEKGACVFEDGMKRYSKHCSLTYRGMLAERHISYDTPFMDEGKAARAAAFAKSLLEQQ